MRDRQTGALCIRAMVLFALTISGLAAAEVPQVASQGNVTPAAVKTVSPKTPHGRAFASPKSCGECHGRIFKSWKRGMHRFSYEDPIFQAAYKTAYLETAGEAAKLCLRCHAPAAYAAGDLALRNPIHRQGVQCDFCHSVEHVKIGVDQPPFALYSSKSLGAPRPVTATTEAHGITHQPLLNTPRFCAGCHEYVVPGGAHVMSTWSEWKESPYPKEGKTCQNCHMPTMGWIVGEDGKTRRINEHDLSRGRTSEKVAESAELRVKKIQRKGSELTVIVEIENVGSGHCLPTGMPSRRLTLEVELHANKRVVDQDFRVYRKVVGDMYGRELQTDADIKLHGRKILSDNRLKPKQPRTETFKFEVDPRQRYKIRAALDYSYSPLLLKAETMKINIKELWR